MAVSRHVFNGLLCAALAVLSACGGGSAGDDAAPAAPAAIPQRATRLAYADPTGDGWRLVRNPAASSEHRVVLDLVGPRGVAVWGVGFNLAAAPGVRFARFDDGSYLSDAGVFKLAVAPGEPKLVAAGVRDGVLMVGMFQKGGPHSGSYNSIAYPSQDFGQDAGQTLLRVAVEIDVGDAGDAGDALSGAAVPLRVVKAKVMTGKTRLEDTTVAVGSLVLR